MSASRTPAEVLAPTGARVLEIVWSNGDRTSLPHRVLRGFCPCAYCQGHSGPVQWVDATDALPARALELVDIFEVGSYALGLAWGDGHRTGIYRFSFLAELGELDPTTDLSKLHFER